MFKSFLFKSMGPSGSAGPAWNPDDSAMSAMDVSLALAAWDYRVPEAAVHQEAAMIDLGAPSSLQGLDFSAAKGTELHPADNAGATGEGNAEHPALSAATHDIPLAAVSMPREVCILPPDHKLTGPVQGKDTALAPSEHFAISEAAGAITWDNEPFLFVLDNEPVQTGEREERLMQAQDDSYCDCGALFLSPWASEGIDNCAFTASCSPDKAVNACLAIDFAFATP